jgi:4-hydroxybenzoate polyprenyltransferase
MTSLGQLPADHALIIDLERDILRSDPAIEVAVAGLKTFPVLALSVLPHVVAGRVPARLGLLPFDAAAGLYDMPRVAALRQAQGENGLKLVVISGLPNPWVAAIGQYLELEWDIAASPGPVDQLPPVASGPATPVAASRLKPLLKVMRLHQWSKNLLVFAPLLLAHRLWDVQALAQTLGAFLCFGLVASSIYVMNDLLDVAQDRKHATKCRRPFASGALSPRAGFVLAPALALSGAGLGLLLPHPFMAVLGAYAILNLGYIFFLKRKLLVDVLALAGGYTLRILAGNAAGPVELSSWLLAFSMFLFLSLALVKRYVELDTTEIDAPGSHKVMGRGYRRSDLDMLSQLGVSSGFAAVVVMALYVDGAGRQGLYRLPELIWLICPVILFVIARIWMLAKRRELPDDPVLFMIKDWRSHLMGAAVAVVLVLAA